MQQIKTYSYETEDLMGKGSMGAVYRAHDHLEGRAVALKVMHASLRHDPELRERFFREARVASTLRHPNIVEVYDCDESDEFPFLAMELLSGATVKDYILQKRPISLAEKVELIAQVCDGLAAAHRFPVVHRDIKPSNIFIHEITNEEGAPPKRIAKLLDFGIVRIPDSTLTVAGRALGTTKYMAPEQIEKRPCEASSDLFSLAIVLYEFLAGVHPFQSSRTTQRIREDQPDRLRAHHPLIPPALEELVHRGLEKDPDKRFASAEQFAAQLRAFLTELQLGRTGSAIVAAKQLPPSLPMDPETAVSPEGKMKAFISLVKQFERELAAPDVDAAQRTMIRLSILAENEAGLAQGVKQCESELALVMKRVERVAMAASAGRGASAVVTLDRGAPIGVFTTQVLPTVQSWDDTIGFSGRSGTPSVPQAPDGVEVHISDSLPLVCPSCGIGNRDSARFCHKCGETLGAYSLPVSSDSTQNVALAHPVAQDGKLVPVETKQRGFRMVEEGRKALALAFHKTKRFVVQVLHLPTPQKLIIAGALVLAIAVTTAPLYLDWWRPVPVERSIGTAVVTAAETQLLVSQDPNSKQLMKVTQGTQVNLLDPFTSLSEAYMRVQFVSPKKNSRPGFVRTTDLGSWASDEAVSALAILSLSRPSQDAEEGEARRFIEELRNYRKRFPGTPQSELAGLDQARLHVRIATNWKNGGRPQVEWDAEFGRANEAIAEMRTNSPEKDQILRIINDLTEPVGPSPPPPASAVETSRQVTLNSYNRRAAELYAEGEFHSVLGQADAMLKIDPKNAKAKSWRTMAEEKLSLLGGSK